MATAEEILAGMPEAQTEETVCIIDPDTRTITVPQALQLLGVESDQEVTRLPFRCPKIVGDNIDLSNFKLRINFQNANGELDIYPITDMQVDGEDITFSWVLSRKVTAYKGTTAFAFCAKNPSADGTVTKEWNTTINKECKSLEGLEAGEDIVSQNPDVLESILARLDALEVSGGTGSGTSGKQVELRNSGTAIQWRYTGDTAWSDLVQISDLTGTDGITPHIGGNGNWYLGPTDTGVKAVGTDGEPGADGKSAYQYAVDGGYTGTEEEFAQKIAREYAEPAQKVTITDTTATVELQPNKLYCFPQAMQNLTITLAQPVDGNIANEYHFIFISGATPTALAIPDTVKVPSGAAVEANKIYEASIMENCLVLQSWEAT